MENIKTEWRKSIFSKMVITFILIITPIYGLSIGIYNWAIQTQKAALSDTMLSQTGFYLDNLEKEIKRIKQLQYYCTTDENLLQLASIPESLDAYDRTRSILLLQQRLQSMASSSIYIAKVSAYLPSINRVVTSTAFENSFPEDEFDMLNLKKYNLTEAQTIYWKNRLFLSVTSLAGSPMAVDDDLKGSDAYRKKPLYIIGIELNMNELKNALKQFSDYLDGGALLFDRNNNYLLSSIDNAEMNAKMSDFIKSAVKTAKSGARTVKINGKSYWAIFVSSDYLNITLSKYIPEAEVLKSLRKYYFWFWVFTSAALLFILLYSFSTYRLIYKPLSQLVRSFRKMEKGDLDISITHNKDDEFGYLYRAFNQMVRKLGALIDQVYKQKILAQNALLKQLQTQINPHFLYNSYFILHRMIVLEDNENAARFSQQLGVYLKFITRSAGDEVTLESETEHSRIYAEIQALRFISRIRLEFGKLPEEWRDIMVPRLIVQPLIENAIEHGLENKSCDGLLKVSFLKSEEDMKITVEDNGNGMSGEDIDALQKVLAEKDNGGEEITGIINIHRRLQYKFGTGSGLGFSRSRLGGLCVTIRIVFERREQ